MSDTATVDDKPNVGVENADATEENAVLDQNGLANLFSQPVAEPEVEEAESEVSDTQAEKPADENEETSEPEEDSSLKVENTEEEVSEETEEETETEEQEETPTDPPRFQKRINKLTAMLKDAQERTAALEKKLESAEPETTGTVTVNQIFDESKLDDLENQAFQAEELVDNLLMETDPEYDDKGRAFWKVGNEKKFRSELLEIKKNARNAIRSVPKRRVFIQQKHQAEEAIQAPFFDEPDHEYYQFAQDTLKSDIYKAIEAQTPFAKAAVTLMIEGQIARDAKAKESTQTNKKVAKKVTKKTLAPIGKAATDTGTVQPETEASEAIRRKLKEESKTGAISEKALANAFS